MGGENIDIEDMQCWVFHIAQTSWKVSVKYCANLFKKYDIWGFIEECYDILHLKSYNCVVNDIEILLKNKGVVIEKNYMQNDCYRKIKPCFTQRQKETCAIIAMRDMLRKLVVREKISYKEALFLFTSSNTYNSLFDFDTGIWKENSEYLLDLYEEFSGKTFV